MYPDLGKQEVNKGISVISVAAKVLTERKEIGGHHVPLCPAYIFPQHQTSCVHIYTHIRILSMLHPVRDFSVWFTVVFLVVLRNWSSEFPVQRDR